MKGENSAMGMWTFGKNRMVFGAFVGVHCVRIMNVVWDKRAEGLETRARAVKIHPLVLFFCYALR